MADCGIMDGLVRCESNHKNGFYIYTELRKILSPEAAPVSVDTDLPQKTQVTNTC